MATRTEQTQLRPDLILKLRETARRGTTVRELVGLIRENLGCRDEVVIPVIAYMRQAFSLPLIEVLPIREWLGSEEDAGIDELILPAIQRTRSAWLKE